MWILYKILFKLFPNRIIKISTGNTKIGNNFYWLETIKFENYKTISLFVIDDYNYCVLKIKTK